MLATKLSKLLYENSMGKGQTEKFRNIFNLICLYNKDIVSGSSGYGKLSIHDLDEVFEDWHYYCLTIDVICVFDNRAHKNVADLNRGDKPMSLKIKGLPKSLSFPFTIEELVEYLLEHNQYLQFRETFRKNGFEKTSD